jgi:transposase
MARLKYQVRLSEEERGLLEGMIRRGKDSARVLCRARTLLKADAKVSETEISEALEVVPATVERIRRRFCEDGLQGALYDRPRPGAEPKLNGKQEAQVIALACSDPPEGHEHWTLRLLADRIVELEFAETYSYEAVRRTLKKMTSNRGKKKSGVFRR